MRTLFNLKRAPDAGRGDIDALLELTGRAVPEELRGQQIDFELKSATGGEPDISTVRDFGLHHLVKWRRLHWLFGVYGRGQRGDRTLLYCLYGSPAQMEPWFRQMEAYVRTDVQLAEHVPALITDDTLTSILGDGESFTYADAYSVLKRQFSRAAYWEAADLPDGRYSRAAMLDLLRQRCAYVIRRGSTLNNPHIPATFFKDWERITDDHAARLRDLVVEALQRNR